MIRVEQLAEASSLLGVAADFLSANEALNNIIFGVSADAAAGHFGHNGIWLVAFDGDVVCGVAIATSPHPIAIAHGSTPEAVAELARLGADLYPNPAKLPFLCGAEAWTTICGVLEAKGMHSAMCKVGQGVYECTNVEWPRAVDGEFRAMRPDEADLIVQWMDAFAVEAMDEAPRDPAGLQKLKDLLVRRGGRFVWEIDGEVVSMAAALGNTPTGIRISYVYTPPRWRGRGFASNITAHLTQHMFDSGRERVFLFTDLANPTSNGIYKAIGYRHVGDSSMYTILRG
ncbi:MAG: GNAT family N-acetyltransferase [bacterium]